MSTIQNELPAIFSEWILRWVFFCLLPWPLWNEYGNFPLCNLLQSNANNKFVSTETICRNCKVLPGWHESYFVWNSSIAPWVSYVAKFIWDHFSFHHVYDVRGLSSSSALAWTNTIFVEKNTFFRTCFRAIFAKIRQLFFAGSTIIPSKHSNNNKKRPLQTDNLQQCLNWLVLWIRGNIINIPFIQCVREGVFLLLSIRFVGICCHPICNKK